MARKKKDDIIEANIKPSKSKAITNKMIEHVCDSNISDKEKEFVLYVVESGNATSAYLKAYRDNDPTVTRARATYEGCKLMAKPSVQKELKAVKKIMLHAMEIDVTQYVNFLQKVANANIGDFVKFKSEVIPIVNLCGVVKDPDTGEVMTRKINKVELQDSAYLDTSLISKIKEGRDGVSIELLDQKWAWDRLKEFFSWQAEKAKDEKAGSNILEAINSKSLEVWKDDKDDDLDGIKEV